MTALFLLPFAAGFLSLLLACASLLRSKRSPAAWCFFAGMSALGIESVFTGLRIRAISIEEVVYWLTCEFVVKSFLPVVWLCFSLTYSRRNYSEFLIRWRPALVLVGLLPIALAFGFRDQLFHVDFARDIERGVGVGVQRVDQSAECHPARFVRPDPDEPGTDLSIGSGNDAMAHQIRRCRPGGHLRRTPLHSNPGDSFLRARHWSLDGRVCCASDWVSSSWRWPTRERDWPRSTCIPRWRSFGLP